VVLAAEAGGSGMTPIWLTLLVLRLPTFALSGRLWDTCHEAEDSGPTVGVNGVHPAGEWACWGWTRVCISSACGSSADPGFAQSRLEGPGECRQAASAAAVVVSERGGLRGEPGKPSRHRRSVAVVSRTIAFA
jgi:hypothetical protein